MIRSANSDDLVALGEERFRETMRAVTVEHEGRPVGIAGVVHREPLQAFSVITPELRRSPMAIARTGRRLVNLVKQYTAPVYAIADSEQEAAPRFLEWLGFEYLTTTHQGRLYIWPKH